MANNDASKPDLSEADLSEADLSLAERLQVIACERVNVIPCFVVKTPALQLAVRFKDVEFLSACCGAWLYEGAGPWPEDEGRGDEVPLDAYYAYCMTCDQSTGLRMVAMEAWPWDRAQEELGRALWLDPLATAVETAELWAFVEEKRPE